MTGRDLIDSVHADLLMAQIEADAARPEGLTFSRVGGCHALAGYVLDGVQRTDAPDRWAAMRGTAVHDLIARYRPGFHEQRVEVEVAGLRLSGAFDEHVGDAVVEYKTRDRDECYRRSVHGAEHAHAIQVSLAAKAVGASKGFVVYVPISGTFEDWVACEIDVEAGFAEAERFVREVLAGDRTRGPHYGWCERFCDYFTACRGGREYRDEPITDRTLVEAVRDLHDATRTRLAAQKVERAAKELLAGIRGRTADGLYEVAQIPVKESVVPETRRRAYVKTEVRSLAAPDTGDGS